MIPPNVMYEKVFTLLIVGAFGFFMFCKMKKLSLKEGFEQIKELFKGKDNNGGSGTIDSRRV